MPSDTKKNSMEQVLAIEEVNPKIKESPSFTHVAVVKAYVPAISFHHRLLRQPLAHQVQAITTRSGVQLLEIATKKKETENTQISTKGNERVEQFEETIENDQQLVSNSAQLKVTVPALHSHL